MSKRDELSAGTETFVNYAFNAFVCGWFIMLILGALAHQLQIPRLAIAYWSAVLIELLAEILFSPGATINPYLRKIVRNI